MAAFLGITLLSGCDDKTAENKATLRNQGIAFMERGDYSSAISSFDAALKQQIGGVTKDDLDICYYKAAAQNASGNMEAAVATYNAILDFEEEAYEAYYLRGCLYCKQGNMEAAKADFLNAIKYCSSDYELYLNIYENLMAAGDEEAGKEYLSKGLSVKGGETMDLEYRGQIHYLLGEYDTAVLELEEAIAAGSTKANLYMGKIYDEVGEGALAEEYYKTYITSAPTDAEALNELGEIMLEKELYSEAVSYFELARDCKVIPNKRALLHNLIVSYEYSGNFDKAWETVQEYVMLFPEDEAVQREYVFLKNRQMKDETADPVPKPETEQTDSTQAQEGVGNAQESDGAEDAQESGNEDSAENAQKPDNAEDAQESNNKDGAENAQKPDNADSAQESSNDDSADNAQESDKEESAQDADNAENVRESNDEE